MRCLQSTGTRLRCVLILYHQDIPQCCEEHQRTACCYFQPVNMSSCNTTAHISIADG